MTNMTYETAKAASAALNETNDCSVKALAIAANLPYLLVHDLLKKHGRKHRDGTYNSTFFAALNELQRKGLIKDYKVEKPRRPRKVTVWSGYDENMNAVWKKEERMTGHYTMKTVAKAFPKNARMVAHVRGHHAAVVNGQVEDWTNNRCHKVIDVILIVPSNGWDNLDEPAPVEKGNNGWDNAEVRRARNTKNKVKADGRVFRSVREAFKWFGFPDSKHQKFRKELKAAGWGEFGGVTFEIV